MLLVCFCEQKRFESKSKRLGQKLSRIERGLEQKRRDGDQGLDYVQENVILERFFTTQINLYRERKYLQ